MVRAFKYRFMQRYLPRFLAFFGNKLLKLILRTCRFEIHGLEQFIDLAAKQKCILMLWHNRLPITGEIFALRAPNFHYTAFVSYSRDGELLARFVTSYKQGSVIRVAHDSKAQALRDLIHNIRHSLNNVAIITPDGPKGPRYKIKPGVALAAKATGAAVIPFTWTSNSLWQLNSWDKMMFPRPFSKIYAYIGAPIFLDKEISREQATELLEQALLASDQKVCAALSSRPK